MQKAPPAEPSERRKAQRLVVVSNGGHLIIDVSEVEWIEAEDYYAAIHIGLRRHLIRESLTSLEARLDPSQFVRIHRSALVNLARALDQIPHAGNDQPHPTRWNTSPLEPAPPRASRSCDPVLCRVNSAHSRRRSSEK